MVVVNHHLLCADFARRATGSASSCPRPMRSFIDEAHQLPEVASNFSAPQ